MNTMEDGQTEVTFANVVAGHVKHEDLEAAVAKDHHNNPDTYNSDSAANQMYQPNADTVVREENNMQDLDGPGWQQPVENLGKFREPANFDRENSPDWLVHETPATGGQADFSRVSDGARDELLDIANSGNSQQNFGGEETVIRDFPNDYSKQEVNGSVQDFAGEFPGGLANGYRPDVNQRRSYGYAENESSFQPAGQFQAVPSHGSDSKRFSNVGGGATIGPLDSPMAEFDAEKRRNNSLGQSTAHPRRSRPLSQHVRDLVFWRNVKDSGVIFSFGLVLLLSLSFFSIISIFAYLSMMSLILMTSFVLIKQIVMAFQQQTSEHPFKQVLEKDVVISPDYAHQQLDTVLKPLNGMLLRIRNLYLADSLGQTLKLIFIMYILTYVGSWFNLLTLLTMIWVGAFTVPKFYVMYKEQIDSIAHVVLEGLRDLKAQASQAVRKQLNKVKPGNRRSTEDGLAGQIRTRGNNGIGKAEVEFKTEGGKISTKNQKKKVAEKMP